MYNLIIDAKALKIIYLLDFSMIKIFGDLNFSKNKQHRTRHFFERFYKENEKQALKDFLIWLEYKKN